MLRRVTGRLSALCGAVSGFLDLVVVSLLENGGLVAVLLLEGRGLIRLLLLRGSRVGELLVTDGLVLVFLLQSG